MSLLNLLVDSTPPAAPPLVLLVLLCPTVLSLRNFLTKKDGAAGSPNLRLVLLAIFLPMVPMLLVSVLDSLRFRGAIHARSSYSDRSSLPPVLPTTNDGRYEEIKRTLITAKRNGADDKRTSSVGARALVTGASSGIGRAIAVQLARRGIPLILVARGGLNRRRHPAAQTDDQGDVQRDELDLLASDLRTCYGVAVSIIRADLSLPGESRRIHAATRGARLEVTYLVLAAGWGPTAQHIDLSKDTDAVERAVRVNVESTAALSSLYGADMASWVRSKKASSSDVSILGPRILIVSSVMGIGPGLPGASLYAATKSFGMSLAQGLKLEMEPLGIGVTVLCPGATRTNFASNSGMGNAAVWNFPLSVMDADTVAEEGVEAMFGGAMTYVPGFMNRLLSHVAVPLVPARIAMRFFRFCWDPWPFSFPPGWRPKSFGGNRKGNNEYASDSAVDSQKEDLMCKSNEKDGDICQARAEWKAQTKQTFEHVGLLERALVLEEAQ